MFYRDVVKVRGSHFLAMCNSVFKDSRPRYCIDSELGDFGTCSFVYLEGSDKQARVHGTSLRTAASIGLGQQAERK